MCAGSRAERSTYLQVNGKVLRRMQAMMEAYPQQNKGAKTIQKGGGKEVNVELFLSPSCCVTVAFTTITIGFSRAYARNVTSGSRLILIEQQHGSDTQNVSISRWMFEYIERIPENSSTAFRDK